MSKQQTKNDTKGVTEQISNFPLQSETKLQSREQREQESPLSSDVDLTKILPEKMQKQLKVQAEKEKEEGEKL